MLKLLLLLAFQLVFPPTFLIAQPIPPPLCNITGSQTSGYVLTATDNGRACQWQTVGGASVNNDTIKNANYIVAGGTADAIVGTTTTTFPGAYAAGQMVVVLITNDNTGSATLNVNSLGARTIQKNVQGTLSNLVAGNLQLQNKYIFVNGTSTWEVLNYTPVAADFPILNQSTTGNASTATALAVNPADCNAGQAAQGINADGTANPCITLQYQTVQDEATPLTQRPALNLTGAGVTCADDAGNTRTNCTIPGGGGGAGVADTDVVFSATPTFTVTASTSIQNFNLTLTGNVTSSTLNTASATDGQEINLSFCQDPTGGWTVALPTQVIGAGTIGADPNSCTSIVTHWNGTNADVKTVTYVRGGTGGGYINIPGSSSGSVNIVSEPDAAGTLIAPDGPGTVLTDSNVIAVTGKSMSGSSNAFTNFGAGVFPTGNGVRKASMGITLSGGGSALASGTGAGVNLDYAVVPFACNIVSWDVSVDQGTAGFRVWRVATGTNIPTVANTITTGDLAISVNTNIHSTTLTNFSATSLAENDILAFHLNAVSSATWARFGIQCEKQ